MYMKRRVTARPILNMINICEIFKSIQGESTYAGMVCTFIRVSGCNICCTYCDTPYAREKGRDVTVSQILDMVAGFQCPLIEITGGEPLLQQKIPELCRLLLDSGYTVLVETNGSRDISLLPDGCIRIMDIKTPGSGCSDSFLTENLNHLNSRDECKLVLCGKDDFDWACDFVRKKRLHETCTVIFSPAAEILAPRKLAEWICNGNIPVRLGLQLHTYIWGNNVRGV